MSAEAAADEFVLLFKRHLNSNTTAQIQPVVCKAVDWDNRTMTAEDENKLPYHNVALGLGAVMTKPAIDSDCIIAILSGEDSVAWLLHAEEAEEIVFREGENGGLIKIKELTDKLNGLTNTVNDLIQAFNTHTHTVATTGTAAAQSGTAAATTTQAQTAADFNKADYEDDQIKH